MSEEYQEDVDSVGFPPSGYDPIVGLPTDPTITLPSSTTNTSFTVSALDSTTISILAGRKKKRTLSCDISLTAIRMSPASGGQLPFSHAFVPPTPPTAFAAGEQIEFEFSYNSGYPGTKPHFIEFDLAYDVSGRITNKTIRFEVH